MSQMRRPTGAWPAWVPLVAVALVLACDLLIELTHPGFAALAPIDEIAHLATAGVLLLGVGVGDRRTAGVCLAAAVLMDLDHLPGVLASGPEIADARPATHSLVVPAVVACAGLALPPAHRWIAFAVAGGFTLHLVRDLATGPGAPALEPFSGGSVTVPYVAYVVLLGAATAAHVVRVMGYDELGSASGSRSR